MCSLDYDGTLMDTQKNLWFLGRAIWVYSFLYNHFGKAPEFLEVARKTKDFVFKYALQKDGWWAEDLSQEGKVLRPFSGDIEGGCTSSPKVPKSTLLRVLSAILLNSILLKW
jgi:hypothetical protein